MQINNSISDSNFLGRNTSDFLKWIDFDNQIYEVKDIDNVESIKISRDENFILNFELVCSIPKEIYNITGGEIEEYFESKIKDKIIIYDPQNNNEIKMIKNNISSINILIISTSNKITIKGESSYIEKYNKNINEKADFSIYLFLNSASKEFYTDWFDITEDDKTFFFPCLNLKYKNIDFSYVRYDKKLSIKGASFLKFRKGNDFLEKFIDDIIIALSYICGNELIPIGCSEYDKNNVPIKITYKCKNHQGILKDQYKPLLSPRNPKQIEEINKSFSNFLSQNKNLTIDEINNFFKKNPRDNKNNEINKFLESYSKNKEKYDLPLIFRYINISRYITYEDAKIYPLSTVFDIIKNKYISEYKDRPENKEKYNKLKTLLEKNKEDKDFIIFKILDMDLSECEKIAIGFRDDVVHGRMENIKKRSMEDIINLSYCYYTLVNRLILKILEIDYYMMNYNTSKSIIREVSKKQIGKYFSSKEEIEKELNDELENKIP